jgi:putative ATPase
MSKPLAEILRPKSLEEYLGQEHLIGEGAILRNAIESGKIPSMILWGPPGVGKTTLARIISKKLDMPFYTLSAINSGVKDVRNSINKSRLDGGSAILFIDEIHRFSKSQQDSLLGAVENGTITLIGATTENPSFEVISPLLSRCQVYVLKHLEKTHLQSLLKSSAEYFKEIYNKEVIFKEVDSLFRISGGDARKLLNAVELVFNSLKTSADKITVNNENTLNIIQQNLSNYDKAGEMHYDIISAFIKSIRGSDPNAAVYYLARMIEGGEDPKFIARRLLILASEDIGNANPNALLLANTCFDAIHKIGWPEGRIILSQTAVYLANSAKSNSTYMAINEAQAEVKKSGDLPVPLHLRNAPTKLMENLDYGKNYKYSHSFKDNFAEQQFLPDGIAYKKFYEPGNNPAEQKSREKLKSLWNSKYGY